jgi:hypothetical protein
MAKTFVCKKCRRAWPVEGFVYRDGGFGTEWDVVPPCRRCRSDKNYRDRYGVGIEELDACLEKQGFSCAICVLKIPELAVGNVDVHRPMGTLRGILCDKCSYVVRNAYYSQSWLAKAASYLEQYAELVGKHHSNDAASRPY